jgi:succinate-semialdehyde dehydrogenase/glutarate-semialdehyde dehydrogenase
MKMILGGIHVDALDKRTSNVVNPATGEIIDTVPLASKADADKALDKALKGFSEWGALPLYERINVVKQFVRAMKDSRDKLWRALQSETAKTTAAASGCIDGSIALAEHYIELSRTLGGETFPSGNRPDTAGDIIMTIREPLGLVLCVLPFNFPVDSYCHKVIPALLMGNAVIVKPASNTPLTDIMLTELLLKAGVPGNALQILTGSGADLGNYLSADPRVDLVNLTGSTKTGLEIARNSAAFLHRLHLELGGNDPLIILADADIEQAVSESVNARIGNAGQVCCAAKRFIVHNSLKDEYIRRLIEKLKRVKIGEPADPAVECGPLISEKAAIELERQLQHCVGQGAKILYGGKRIGGAFFEATVMETPAICDAAHDLELFGPVWSVIGCNTADEAVEIANATMYGLSAGIIGKDMKAMTGIASRIHAGSCVINGAGAYRSADQPFGGYKMSGLGREGGRYTLEELSQVKTIVLRGVL